MIAGNLLALLQINIKRLLAYSSIAHMGYLLIAVVVAATPEVRSFGVETALVYLAGYVVMTLAAFGVVTVLSDAEEDAEELTAYDGLFWRRPVLAAVLAAARYRLAGIPLTVGVHCEVLPGGGGRGWCRVGPGLGAHRRQCHRYLLLPAHRVRHDQATGDRGRDRARAREAADCLGGRSCPSWFSAYRSSS